LIFKNMHSVANNRIQGQPNVHNWINDNSSNIHDSEL